MKNADRTACINLAKWLLADEAWFKAQSLADAERYIESLADEIEQAAESQLDHFRESLHVEV